MRLLVGNTPVHSDMVMWNTEDQVESAALQLIHILFSVPQFSMRIDQLSEEHYKMSQFYLNFMREHQDVLLDGELIPYHPEMLYPVVEGRGTHKKIFLISTNMVIDIDVNDKKEIYLVNGGLLTKAYLNVDKELKGKIIAYDCMGNTVYEENIHINQEVRSLSFPKSGVLHLILE